MKSQNRGDVHFTVSGFCCVDCVTTACVDDMRDAGCRVSFHESSSALSSELVRTLRHHYYYTMKHLTLDITLHIFAEVMVLLRH